jgi:hypothetical protein
MEPVAWEESSTSSIRIDRVRIGEVGFDGETSMSIGSSFSPGLFGGGSCNGSSIFGKEDNVNQIPLEALKIQKKKKIESILQVMNSKNPFFIKMVPGTSQIKLGQFVE